jgi:hypothetical protein
MTNTTSNGQSTKTTYDLSAFAIKLGMDIPPPEPIIFFNEAPFGIQGEFSFINGAPKAGKTFAVVPNIIAAALSRQETDTLSIRVKLPDGKKILVIDTEQPKGHVAKVIEIAARKIGIESKEENHPQNVEIAAIRGIPREARKEAVFQTLEKYGNQIGIFILDGLADLLDDPNNAKSSFELIEELTSAAERYNFCGIAYMHFNPGTEKMRGHAGSEAERKGAATISVVKNENGTHYFKGKYFRYGMELQNFPFKYDTTKGMFVSITDPAEMEKARKSADKDFQNKRQLTALAYAATGNGEARLSHTDLAKAIQISSEGKCSLDAAKKRVKRMAELEILIREENIYRFNMNAKAVYLD